MEDSLDRISDGYQTVTGLKRANPTYSRRKILQLLHQRGLCYQLLPKEENKSPKRKPCPSNVQAVVSHIAQAMADKDACVLYCDEMKFPLVQTAKHWWHIS